jgi:hypothetical protein
MSATNGLIGSESRIVSTQFNCFNTIQLKTVSCQEKCEAKFYLMDAYVKFVILLPDLKHRSGISPHQAVEACWRAHGKNWMFTAQHKVPM